MDVLPRLLIRRRERHRRRPTTSARSLWICCTSVVMSIIRFGPHNNVMLEGSVLI
jgi:hypothetical protein